ncbi:hypothetical protein KKD49_11285, partial [Myxococcota bacterium]|nr:hypothetical protein [Myxococcota bacterium]
MMFRLLLIIILMCGCDNPQKVISDAGQDIPDVPEDIDSDIQDAPDVHDADITDTTDATEITEDPHEVLITC